VLLSEKHSGTSGARRCTRASRGQFCVPVSDAFPRLFHRIWLTSELLDERYEIKLEIVQISERVAAVLPQQPLASTSMSDDAHINYDDSDGEDG
jgi:hypothetical protein